MSNHGQINEHITGGFLNSQGDPFENILVGLFVDPRARNVQSAVRRVALSISHERLESMTAQSPKQRLALMAYGITHDAVRLREIYSCHLLAALAICPGITIPDCPPSDLTGPPPLKAKESWIFCGKSLPINITETRQTDTTGWTGHIVGVSDEVLEAGREQFPLRSVVGVRFAAVLPHPLGHAALQDVRRVVYTDGVYIGIHVDAQNGTAHEETGPYPSAPAG